MKSEKKGKAFAHRSAEGDFFQTPYPMTRALLDREKFPKLVLEPASGKGAITRVLEEYGYSVIDYDLNTGERLGYLNFLEEDSHFPGIVTNPPYSLADEFVMKAKSLKPKKFAFLLRVNYLSGQGRYEAGVFDNLARVYIFTRMPDLRAPIREDGRGPTAAIVYAWLVWEIPQWWEFWKRLRKAPRLFHIDYQHAVLSATEYSMEYAEKLMALGIIKKLPRHLQEKKK